MSTPLADREQDAQAGLLAARTVDLVKTYGHGETAVQALRGVSLDFPTGQFTAVMGPSGSGKSTLLHCLAALDTPSGGTVLIGDTDLSTLNEKQLTRLRRDRIGFVFQAYNLVPTLDAAENIVLPQRLAGRKPDLRWLDTILDTVGLRDRLHHRPSELSGGQQQRVAVARALAGRPEIVFADEPTGNLDSRAGGEVLSFLRASVDDHRQTVVMVTHDPNAAAYADRVIFLADGRVVAELRDPTPEAVFDRLKSLDSRAQLGA
jgi:putative ABC transport system ATP-binding protein